MAKIVEPTKLHQDTPMSMREWILLIPKHAADNQPEASQVGYDWIKQEFEDDVHTRLLIEEMLIGYKHKFKFNHFLIRIK